MELQERKNLWEIGLRTIEELQVPEGILASGKDECACQHYNRSCQEFVWFMWVHDLLLLV